MSCTGDALGGKISGSLLTMAGGLGPVIPIVTATLGGPITMFGGLVFLTMGAQVLNSSLSRKERIQNEIEKQNIMCNQTKLINTQVEQLDSLLNTLENATTIQKSTEDRLQAINNAFLTEKELLQEKQNEYKKHLSIYGVMNIMILFYLYLVLYYK